MIKAGKLNESRELNESAKTRNMNKNDGMGYSGIWQLPSGKPGMVADAGDMELAVLGDEEGIQLILQNEDGDMWYKDYPAAKEKDAVSDFKKMAAVMTDLVDASKLAKKYGLK